MCTIPVPESRDVAHRLGTAYNVGERAGVMPARPQGFRQTGAQVRARHRACGLAHGRVAKRARPPAGHRHVPGAA